MDKTYLQFVFNVDDEELKDILIAKLSEIGFDGFEEKDNSLIAFVDSADFKEEKFNEVVNSHHISFSKNAVKQENWNKLWEQNFQPVIINDEVAIRASFHQPIKNVQHEIIITPKMSFGTGHHATTHMMLKQMRLINFKGKSVLDFGTGTGVLAIYAEKLGAASIFAIDNDEWSISNAAENIQQNNCCKINLMLADKPVAGMYEIILANINKNIITDNFKNIVQSLDRKVEVLLSGLLEEDEQDILALAAAFQLQHIHTSHRDKWICIKLCRQNKFE